MSQPGDRDLGMNRPIRRRDFLNGVGFGLTGTLALPWFTLAGPPAGSGPEPAPVDYPPARTGMRGSHDGSWEVAHALRDGQTAMLRDPKTRHPYYWAGFIQSGDWRPLEEP